MGEGGGNNVFLSQVPARDNNNKNNNKNYDNNNNNNNKTLFSILRGPPLPFRYIGRPVSASTATGNKAQHIAELQDILDHAI